jgi:hypothetical protein
MRSTRDLNGVPFAEVEVLRIDRLFLSIGEQLPAKGRLPWIRTAPSFSVLSFSLFPFELDFIRFDDGSGGMERDDFIPFSVLIFD